MNLSKSLVFSLLLLFAAFSLFLSCSSDEDEPVIYLENVEVSYITPAQAPAVDGVLEPIWQAASATQLISESGSDYNPSNKLALVNISALCDSEYVYISASWKDVTMNDRFLQLIWNNQQGWNRPNISKEDNISFMFLPVDGSTTDNDPNCFAMCHTPSLIMLNETGRPVDGWYWRASLTDSIFRAVDMWLVDTLDADTSFLGLDTEFNPGYMFNAQDSSAVPKFWKGEIQVDTIVVNEDTTFTVDNGKCLLDTDTATYTSFPMGVDIDSVVVPSFVTFTNASGSRWDVEAKGVWDEVSGRWTVEFKRLLNTGNDDDIEFVIGEQIRMAVAIGDNTKHAHIGFKPFILEF